MRRLEESDLTERVRWFNSEPIYSNVPIDIPASLNDTRKWFSNNALNQSRRDFTAILSEGSDQNLISMAGLVAIEYRHRCAEFYMFMNPNFIGRGLGTLVLRWVCNYGFTELALNKISLFTVESNVGARKFYERNGFVPEGCLRKHHLHRGQFVDRYIHGLLSADWKKQSWSLEAPPSAEISL
mgnify:CR=1 FL=1|jgi:RimJ/RimL family protein N-acetyltransferase